MAGTRAGYNFSGEDKLASKQARRARDVAIGDLFANERAGDHFATVNHWGKDDDLEPVFRAQPSQEIHIAGLLVAEAKIFSDEQGPDAQVAKKNLLDKLLWRAA